MCNKQHPETVSLETANKLKYEGYPMDCCLMYWFINAVGYEWKLVGNRDKGCTLNSGSAPLSWDGEIYDREGQFSGRKDELAPAPTFEEVLELLPNGTTVDKDKDGLWSVSFDTRTSGKYKRKIDAAIALWSFLVHEKVIKPKKSKLWRK